MSKQSSSRLPIIVQLGAPTLRAPAALVSPDEIRSAAMRALIAKMRRLMHKTKGVGLAAPQIGIAKQFFIMESNVLLAGIPEDQARDMAWRKIPFCAYFNPRIVEADRNLSAYLEGCLSFRGFRGLVQRSTAIKIEALDSVGNLVQVEFDGWAARVVQHEIDHLNGCIYIDRVRPQSIITLSEYEKMRRELTWSGMIAQLGSWGLTPPPELPETRN
jgi:peptide deformylase